MKVNKKQARTRKHVKVRAKISGTAGMPRVAVYRSNAHIYAQAIDDVAQKTIFGASDKNLKGTKSEKSEALGKLVAETCAWRQCWPCLLAGSVGNTYI